MVTSDICTHILHWTMRLTELVSPYFQPCQNVLQLWAALIEGVVGSKHQVPLPARGLIVRSNVELAARNWLKVAKLPATGTFWQGCISRDGWQGLVDVDPRRMLKVSVKGVWVSRISRFLSEFLSVLPRKVFFDFTLNSSPITLKINSPSARIFFLQIRFAWHFFFRPFGLHDLFFLFFPHPPPHPPSLF